MTVAATGVNKTYDGTNTATVTLADDRVAGDALLASYGAATFNHKNVGDDKPIDVIGITVAGTDAANYSHNATAIYDGKHHCADHQRPLHGCTKGLRRDDRRDHPDAHADRPGLG